MIRSGEFVSEYIDPKGERSLDPKAVQPNGVDLSVDKIYRHSSDSVGVLNDESYQKPEREEAPTVEPEPWKIESEIESYYLKPGSYVVEYAEIVEIPENHIGVIYPRSRLMRCGGMLFSAVWDSGYRGKGEGGLWVGHPMSVQTDMRIGQIVFYTTEELDEHYSGSHQHENID